MTATRTARLRHRLLRKIERLDLRLDGKGVLTEAATGAYAVTPVIAGLAGAQVWALARASIYGSEEAIRREIGELAPRELQDRIQIVEDLDEVDLKRVDIVTNSGHLRPLGEKVVGHLGRGAMVSLMYASWELRETDVDLDLCATHGVPVVAVNEAHPELETYKTNALLVLKALDRLGVEVFDASVAVVADNLIGGYVQSALTWLGARVHLVSLDRGRDWRAALMACSDLDAIVLVVRRLAAEVSALLAAPDAMSRLCDRSPSIRAVLIMGDVDLSPFLAAGIECYPSCKPEAGHMAINTHESGYNAIASLQAGGLKVGEIVSRLHDELHDWEAVRRRLVDHPLARWLAP